MRQSIASVWLLVSILCACSSVTQGGDAADVADASSADVTITDGGTVDAVDLVVGDSGGGACEGGTCSAGLSCCNSGCMNLANDPLNCGTCGHVCAGATSMCSGGGCVAETCVPACGAGSVCCEVNRGGPVGGPACYAGVTCPVGCPLCR
ncbi:MAG: hypothetical protein WCJ30_17645 [Deltaproteobacteria bacterium]